MPNFVIHYCCQLLVIALLVGALFAAPRVQAQTAEDFQKLKAMVEQMQKTIEAQNARIAELETNKAAHLPVPAVSQPPGVQQLEAKSQSLQIMEKLAAGGTVSRQSQVTYRDTLNDQQEAASRPKDYTLDPTYHGFIPVPNTGVLIKFNAKPRVDMISDNMNAGNKNRFAPALFPLKGDANYGGGEQFNVTANGSQLRLDVRAPEMAGDFRFYYQNDFTGDDTKDMKFRLQHLYGELYGFKAGFTYGVWEDPDAWPDTVDYEGPNGLIFARRPVAQYTLSWNDNWNTTFGLEKPDIFVDVNSGPNPGGSTITRMPDVGLNTRFEEKGFGHLQFSALFRDLGAKDSLGDSQHAFGWGLNVGAGLELGPCNTAQLLGVYGAGVGGLGNDSGFYNSDAAYDADGHFKALPYWSAAVGFTHKWNDKFRSTITYGYDNVDNTSGQEATFYHFTHYASANIVWQLRKRLSVGLEGLYGFKEVNDGANSGDHWRVQLGMVYALFD